MLANQAGSIASPSIGDHFSYILGSLSLVTQCPD